MCIRDRSHPRSGCNRRTLPLLYQSLIWPIIDFGFPMYGHLKLDPIQDSAIRLQALSVLAQLSVSARWRVSPPPFHFRRLTLSAKFLTTILQYPDLPIFQRVFIPSPSDKTHSQPPPQLRNVPRSLLQIPLSIIHTAYLSSVVLQLTKYHPLTR